MLGGRGGGGDGQEIANGTSAAPRLAGLDGPRRDIQQWADAKTIEPATDEASDLDRDQKEGGTHADGYI